jgi:hypothetical protein
MNLQRHYLSLLSARPVAYNPKLAKYFKSINAALLLSQFLYWTEHTDDPDGWFWKTRAELYEEIGMGRYEFEGARRRLVEVGVLEEEFRGMPARNYYRLNIPKFEEIISSGIDPLLAENHQQVGGKPADRVGEKPPTSRGKTSKPYKEADSTSDTTPHTTSREKRKFTTYEDERAQVDRVFNWPQ